MRLKPEPGKGDCTDDSVAILIPTLGRPDRIEPLLDCLQSSTQSRATPYFVVERHDTPTIEAAESAKAQVIVNKGESTYASCINTGYRATREPFLFLGADDIEFMSGWLEAALVAMADEGVGVVGTFDPKNPMPDHSAHSLVKRQYVHQHGGCIDLKDIVLYPYHHGFTDHEFIGVAKARGAYRYCRGSLVKHHHPGWDSLGRVRGGQLLDKTYRKGNRNHRIDTVRFIERSRLWAKAFDPVSESDRRIRKFIGRNRGWRGATRFRLRVCAEFFYGLFR